MTHMPPMTARTTTMPSVMKSAAWLSCVAGFGTDATGGMIGAGAGVVGAAMGGVTMPTVGAGADTEPIIGAGAGAGAGAAAGAMGAGAGGATGAGATGGTTGAIGSGVGLVFIGCAFSF